MKGLFVIHSTNMVYGASKSLAQLLNNINYEFDIIFPKSISDNITDDEIRRVYGPKINKIFRFWLPYENCFLGKPKLKMNNIGEVKQKVKYTIRQTISKIFLYKVNEVITQNNYDFVYLNSLTLYPLINEKHKYFLHVREIVDTSSSTFRKIVSKMNKACGVLFIDYATQIPFKEYVKNELIINNPFDMRKLSEIDAEAIYQKYSIPNKNTVFAILGTISESKGIDFIIKSYIKANVLNSTLLIVGNNNNDYGEYCKGICLNNKNIIFVEEIKDPSEIYKITDYVLRADPTFAIGRTVYEGLYSGCNVIIQGEKDIDCNKIFEYLKFEDKISFYSPRNEEEIIEVIKRKSFLNVNNQKYESNIDRYIVTHNKYIRKCLYGE